MNLKQIKEMYEAERETIQAKLNVKKGELDLEGDDLDRIQGIGIASMIQQLSDRDIVRLNRLDIAINKCNDGSVMECEDCGNNIGMKRLMAVPGVSQCISCVEAIERNNRNYV